MAATRYAPGDWYAIPLLEGGFAAGIVARAKSPALFGYFFGPRRRTVPTLEQVSGLTPEQAVLVGTFGHLGIVTGRRGPVPPQFRNAI
jgi:hypothetical protein